MSVDLPRPGLTAAPQSHGFTLLELLVALAVFGFLLVGLTQGTRFGLLAWATSARLSVGNDDLDTVDATLRHLIEGINPGDDLDPAPMSGGSDRLDCVTALPNASDAMPVRRMRAALLVDGAHRLVLQWRPYLNAMHLGPLPRATDTELLRGVARLELFYSRPGGGWVSTWRGTDLPTLVRVRLLFPTGDSRHWPDIVAAPLLDRP
jgi:general secretion pathway protein J